MTAEKTAAYSGRVNKRLWIPLVAIAAVIAVGVVLLWPKSSGPLPTIDKPIAVDNSTTLTMPNVDSKGKPMPVPKYEQDSTETSDVLTIPLVDEPCGIEPDGSIGAPKDYTKACLYNAPAGGQAVLSHSVRGPRTGVFDNLGHINVGSPVTIAGVTYTVQRVDTFPADAIPSYVWSKGRLSLITCTLMPEHETNPSAPWTHTTVVTLGV